MRIVSVLSLAAIILAIIVVAAPHVTMASDDSSVYSIDFLIAAPMKVAQH